MVMNLKNWKAISDANTIMEYNNILNDSKRLAAARKAAARRAKDIQDEANRLNNFACGGKMKSRKK